MNSTEKNKKSANCSGLKMRSRMLIIACGVCLMAVFSSFIVTAKTTYIINDDEETVTIESRHTDGEAVIEQAGINLEPEDTYTSRNVGDNVEITIRRANNVTIYSDFTVHTYNTLEETVGDVLNEYEVQLGADDVVNYELMDKVSDGMIIKVDRVSYEYAEKLQTIEYETVEVEDESLYMGIKRTTTEGQDGEEKLTYRSTYVNGEFTETELYKREVVEEPVDEVLSIGTKDLPTGHVSPYSGDSYSSDSDFSYSYVIDMTATAYTTERQSNKITASGAVAQVGIVAADFSTLPMGTRVYITAADGSWTYGYAVVGDTGVTGTTLDLFFDTWDECVNFGVRSAVVYVLN